MLKMFVLLSLLAVAAAQLHQGDWPQFGRTASFISFNGVSSTSSGKEWTYNVGNRVVASPAVAAGRVWTGSDDGYLYCFNQSTGEVIWKFRTGLSVRSSPAVGQDLSVVFGSYDTHVYKVSVDGQLVWKVATAGQIYGPATITANGTVLIGSQDSSLYHISADGKVVWTFKAKSAVNSGPAIGDHWQDRTVVRSYDNNIYCISLADGKLIWKVETGGPGGATATIVGDDVFIGSWDQKLYKIDISTGKVEWTFAAQGEIESHPAFQDGILYLTAEESKAAYAINATTGDKIWEYNAAEEFNGSPSLSKDLVYVGANDHYMHVLDRFTGQLKFKFETCANVFASAAIADNGMVFFSCNTATLDLAGNSTTVEDQNLGVVYAVNPSLHLDVAK
eukprot:m.92673 g.92673  ORF g.92673 m.92673 type:complete len:391 (-) comp14954_c0_seq1:1323-2495(-)